MRMSDADDNPALIITDGGIAGFLACWAEGVCRPPTAGAKVEPAGPVAWIAPDASDQGRACALANVEVCRLVGAATGRGAFVDGLLTDSSSRETGMLLGAGFEAASRGLARVVWPVVVGSFADEREAESVRASRLAEVFDRALLVARLVGVSSVIRGGATLRIETPFVEFSDAQLLDAAVDMDAALPASCVCDVATPTDRGALVASAPCGQCVSCARWTKAAETVGVRLSDVVGGGVRV